MQAPASKVQPPAPQEELLVEQTAVQQFPLPATPQILDLQASFSVQAPVVIGKPQTPALQTKPAAQSRLAVQVVLQPPSAPQPRLLGQLVGSPTWQLPLPSQLLWVTVALVQLLPQETAGWG
jgi:hypothetical protein